VVAVRSASHGWVGMCGRVCGVGYTARTRSCGGVRAVVAWAGWRVPCGEERAVRGGACRAGWRVPCGVARAVRGGADCAVFCIELRTDHRG
jgi:hypothetical protein